MLVNDFETCSKKQGFRKLHQQDLIPTLHNNIEDYDASLEPLTIRITVEDFRLRYL